MISAVDCALQSQSSHPPPRGCHPNPVTCHSCHSPSVRSLGIGNLRLKSHRRPIFFFPRRTQPSWSAELCGIQSPPRSRTHAHIPVAPTMVIPHNHGRRVGCTLRGKRNCAALISPLTSDVPTVIPATHPYWTNPVTVTAFFPMAHFAPFLSIHTQYTVHTVHGTKKKNNQSTLYHHE
jgi:hypothetical protein